MYAMEAFRGAGLLTAVREISARESWNRHALVLSHLETGTTVIAERLGRTLGTIVR